VIISHTHRFIFIKTRKTAGTSIEVFLSGHCGEGDVFTPILPHVEPHVARNHKGFWNPQLFAGDESLVQSVRALAQRRKFWNHMPARMVRDRVPEHVWRDYYKVAVERNPWDKTLSHFHMHKARPNGPGTLDEYLARGRFCLNYPQYTDRAGALMVDRVVRYENLMDELGAVFAQVGIPFSGDLGVQAKANFRGDRAHYRHVYTEQQRRIIERVFAPEIALFDYTF
jgi:hypothetical protein